MIRYVNILCFIFCVAITLGFSIGAWAQDKADNSLSPLPPSVKQAFGNWDYDCEEITGAPEPVCSLSQTVLAQDYPAVKLEVLFYKIIDSNDILMTVTVPLGVLVNQGLGLSVDDADLGLVPFTRCGVVGCMANVQMDETLFGKLFKGKKSHFTIAFTPETRMGLPFQLGGLTEGVAKLRAKKGT